MKKKQWLQANGPIAEVRDPDGKLETILATSATDIEFLAPIGSIMTMWSLWETHVNDLIWSVLKARGKTEQGWYGLTYSKREALLKDLWSSFCCKHPTLQMHLENAVKDARAAKVLRDRLAHDIIHSGVDLRDQAPMPL